MRVLLINPNTSPAITEHVLGAARQIAPELDFVGATGRLGARYISSRASYAIAAHAALDVYAERAAGADAVILACFGDPGLGAMREIATIPVVGMAEAACREASTNAGKFAIVTGGARWEPILREFVHGLGLAQSLASVRVIPATGAQIAADPEGSVNVLADACRAAARDDGAQTIILGGAGLAGLAPRIAALVDVPIVDALKASIEAVKLSMAHHKEAPQDDVPAAIDTIGLSTELSRLLTGRAK